MGSFKESSCGAVGSDSQPWEWQDCLFSNIFSEKLQTYSNTGRKKIHEHLSAHHSDPMINLTKFCPVSPFGTSLFRKIAF